MSETQLRNAIRNALNALPGIYLMTNAQARRGKTRAGLEPGSADLVGIIRLRAIAQTSPSSFACIGNLGRFFAIEVKTPRGSTSKERAELQAAWRAKMRQLGGFSCIVTSIDDALRAVERARRGESD